MRALSFFTTTSILAALAAGCSSSSSGGGGGGADGGEAGAVEAGGSHEAAAVDGAGEEATEGEGGTVCNALTNAAPTITADQIAQDPPAAQGGTVVDGTYWMSTATIYTGIGGPTGPTGPTQTTIQISGSTIQVVSSGDPTTRTVSLATSGTSFTATDTCPDTSASTGSYTATASTFVIMLAAGTDDAGARTLVETFTKQ